MSTLSLSLSEMSVSDASSPLPAKRFIPTCNVLHQVLKSRYGRNACGGGGGGCRCFFVTYRILYHRCLWFCRFFKLVWKLLRIESKRHMFTFQIPGSPWSTRFNLRKPTVRAMLVLVTFKVFSSNVLFCTFRIRQNLPSCRRFKIIVISYWGLDVFSFSVLRYIRF